ncbi:urea ABC transporter permease subunit UrtB [Psychrobacter arenosus]
MPRSRLRSNFDSVLTDKLTYKWLASFFVCMQLLIIPATTACAQETPAALPTLAMTTTDALAEPQTNSAIDAEADSETGTPAVSETSLIPPELTDQTATTAISGDAIEQFVAKDFAGRQTMLNSWSGSVEALDSLVELIESDALYQDNSGTTYILETNDAGDETLLSYPDKTVLEKWPNDLKQVTLTNALRSALIFGQAKVKLDSDEPSQRLDAVQILDFHLNQVDPSVITTALANESNDKVKTALIQLNARLEFLSGGLDNISNEDNTAGKLAALEVLKDSSSPDVMVDIEKALQAPDLDPALEAALIDAQESIARRLKMSEWSGHIFTGMSTASILLLAALGLAITFGLLGVINMAHGELIMIGAYTTYVVQSLFKTHLSGLLDWYLIAAIPAAFLVSAVIGMIIERIVIRPLYGRELETLLATFGVSLILMQLVRMIFGAQNVEVTNIAWLSGAYQLTPSLSLPFNRIAIIGFTTVVLMLLLYLLNKTRFGLFIRAVTQNRQMARAVGIRSARIDMMAFGLGSGLAGLAGCALAQVGNVGPDLGQTYIIDAFLVVVVGGVGQVWGAVLASLGLGISGTVLEIGMGAVLAKIILLVLVILFIQKRPQGLFALKGRFVE